MNLQLKDCVSGYVLTGSFKRPSFLTRIKSTKELFFLGAIRRFNEQNGVYEIEGLSLKGRPIMNDPICLGCSQKWKNCDHCQCAARDPQWVILPEGMKVEQFS